MHSAKPIDLKKDEPSKWIEILIIFFISPFFALINVLLNYKKPWSKNIVWIFVVFFGYTFIISGQKDSVRYTQRLEYLAKQNVGSFSEFVSFFYDRKIQNVDIVEPFITFLISRFTENGHVLMAVFGLVFGYFYSRNIWFLLDKVNDKIKREALLFLLLASFIVAIWAINGFRFWTATHVFVYGLFLYNDGKRIKGTMFCILSFFIHFSFALPLLLFIIYVLFRKQLLILTALYLSSFFIAQISPQLVKTYSENIPEVFQDRTESYLNKEYIKGRLKSQVNVNWYVNGRITVIGYAISSILVFIMLRHRNAINKNQVAAGILSYALILATVGNLLSQVPSAVRFLIVAYLIFSASFFLFIQAKNEKVLPVWIKWPFGAAALLYLIVEIRLGFDMMGLLTILGNPLTTLFIEDNVPLINYIK